MDEEGITSASTVSAAHTTMESRVCSSTLRLNQPGARESMNFERDLNLTTLIASTAIRIYGQDR